LNISQATAVSTGGYHTCAIVGSGNVKCWGFNAHGQLGDGTLSDSSTPVDVIGITSAKAIVAGEYHSCAALTDGSVACWGEDSNNELGDGDSADSPAPVNVQIDRKTPPTLLGNANSVSASTAYWRGTHTCALTSNGAIYCWGLDSYGQLGDQGNTNSNIALRVPNIVATAVGAGAYSTCALLSGGSVRCWGSGTSGELGDGKGTDSLTPVTVSLTVSATVLAKGSDHGCVILGNATHTVQCWGLNDSGQLGDASFTQRNSPVDVRNLSQATALSSGYKHTCAVVAGAVYCWGDSTFGQLGSGNTTLSSIPKLVTGF